MATQAALMSDPKVENGARDPVSPIPIEILEDPWTPAWEVARIATEAARREREPGTGG